MAILLERMVMAVQMTLEMGDTPWTDGLEWKMARLSKRLCQSCLSAGCLLKGRRNSVRFSVVV